MKSLLAFGFLALLIATPAPAQTPPSGDPAQIPAGTYAADAGHTQVGWQVSHMGFSNYAGGFSDASEVSDTLEVEPKNPAAAKLAVKIPVASVTTSAKLTDEFKGDRWLDAAKFADMTFVSAKAVPVGKDHAKVTGDLTLHGVAKPVTLDVTLAGAGVDPLSKKVTVGFEATGTKRSESGLKIYVPPIGNDLHLTIAGAFEKQQ